MATKKEEPTITVEVKPLLSSSHEDHTVWTVEKMYVNFTFRVGSDDYTSGFNIVPPVGHEMRVAIRNQNEMKALPDGVVLYEEFEKQFLAMADSVVAFRNRIQTGVTKKPMDKEGF